MSILEVTTIIIALISLAVSVYVVVRDNKNNRFEILMAMYDRLESANAKLQSKNQDEDLKNLKGIDCYALVENNHQGAFYNINDFVLLREKLSSKLENERKRNYKLSLLKDSIDFYKLDEDGKQSLDDDLSYSNELIEEYERKVYICQYMIDTMELFKDMFGKWEDDMEVYIYIE